MRRETRNSRAAASLATQAVVGRNSRGKKDAAYRRVTFALALSMPIRAVFDSVYSELSSLLPGCGFWVSTTTPFWTKKRKPILAWVLVLNPQHFDNWSRLNGLGAAYNASVCILSPGVISSFLNMYLAEVFSHMRS